MIKECLACGKEFKIWPSAVERGRGKYCSKKCYDKMQTKKVKQVCSICKKEFEMTPSCLKRGSKFCSRKCYALEKRGKKSCHWKNGMKKTSDGRILVYAPDHPFHNKQNYVRRSRLVMEQMLGRYLKPEEVAHHRGIKYPIPSIENKQDDRPENLQLFFNNSEHRKFHRLFP